MMSCGKLEITQDGNTPRKLANETRAPSHPRRVCCFPLTSTSLVIPMLTLQSLQTSVVYTPETGLCSTLGMINEEQGNEESNSGLWQMPWQGRLVFKSNLLGYFVPHHPWDNVHTSRWFPWVEQPELSVKLLKVCVIKVRNVEIVLKTKRCHFS